MKDEVTRNFIITDKGRENGITSDSIAREASHIVCASQYDYFGQVDIYASSYFKNNCLVGVSITAKGSVIDNFIGWRVKNGYLIEDKS